MARTHIFFLLLHIGLAWSDPVNQGCATGWYQNNNDCYLFNTNKMATRQQAWDECDTSSAELLHIDNADTLAFIQKQLQSFSSSDGFWTSLTNLRFDGTEVKGPWKWGSYSVANMSQYPWEKYPTNDAKRSCGALNVKNKFQNSDCSRRQPYICQKPLATGNSKCPPGWGATTTSCMFFSNISDPGQFLNWQDAKSQCIKMGGHLVTISNAQDLSGLQALIIGVGKTTLLFWTGLQMNGGNWAFYNGDKYNTTFVVWDSEPTNIYSLEHCAIIRPDGKFSDSDCSRTYNFICTKPITYTNTDYYFGCNGWQRAGQKCYHFYDQLTIERDGARQICQEMGGSLVNIQSLDESYWIQNQMLDESHIGMYWIGLNDMDKEGVYKWTDGSLVNSSIIKWNEEPNSWRGDEDCASVRAGGLMNDEDCYRHIPAICKLKYSAQCPQNWVSYPKMSTCYYITPFNQTFTASEARTFCQQTMAQKGVSTDILNFATPDEYKFIGDTILSQTQYDVITGYWTGVNDQKSDGIWENIDNSPLQANMLVWGKEPYDPTGTKDCVFLGWGGRAICGDCSAQLNLVCEKYAYGQVPWGTGGSANLSPSLMLILSITFIALFR